MGIGSLELTADSIIPDDEETGDIIERMFLLSIHKRRIVVMLLRRRKSRMGAQLGLNLL